MIYQQSQGHAPSPRVGNTHIRPLNPLRIRQDVPQDIHLGIRLDRDPGLHAFLVDVADEFLRACRARSGLVLGRLGRHGGDGGFVVEAVEVAAGVFEFLDPSLRLRTRRQISGSFGI
jgi:hypothetical protein